MKAPAARFSVPLDRPPGPLAFISWPLQVANFAVAIGSAIAFAVLQGWMPPRVPLHHGPRGEIDRWGPPSELWGVAVLPALMLLLPWLLTWVVSAERWALPTDNPEPYGDLELRRRKLLVRFGERLALVLTLGFCGFWLTIGWPGWGFGVAMVFILASSGPFLIALLVWHGRALAGIDRQRRELAGSTALGTHADGWKLGGLVYFAPDDPAIIVPKLVGIGSTVNFARPSVLLLMAALLAGPLLFWSSLF